MSILTLRLVKRWSTHMPMLIKTIQLTHGPVLELGAGVFSTPLIHWLCAESRRYVVTYESDPQFFGFSRQFRSKSHKIKFIEDWTELNEPRMWSVVFIDHVTEHRARAALQFKDNAMFVILHDSEPERENTYHYSTVYPHYKYRYDWTFNYIWTTVVSNFDDLQRLSK